MLHFILAACSTGGGEGADPSPPPQEGGGDCSGLDRRSEGIPRYINALMMVFVPDGIVIATLDRLVKKKISC